ncbi:phage tail spike protein [Weissella confusa]|uniref:Uncharacterized protein n=1 Tax=Weissella confusa TaxID=1583 RepID=A0A4Z0S0J8_WEICO|nr:phage tail spike protein [Weissella confusa]TGE74916.1 hypothetical protein C6P11_02715 [Weissella confusa]
MYTVLDPRLNVVGFLSNKGRGANDFWGDTISQQIADTQDILGNVDLTVDNVSRNIDVSGNTKNWNHTLNGISFNNTLVGAQVENGYYLLYQDDANKRHYLMQLTSVSEKVTPGGQHYKTATGVNAALYDFSRMIVDAKEFYASPTGTQTLGSLQNILRYILGHAGWNVNVEDYNFPDITYSISDGASVQSVLQDIIKLFEVDVDAYVTMTPQGQLAQRVVSFRQQMGADSGVTIRYGKNMTDMTREELSDSIYTKLYVQGANSLKLNTTNNGLPYIVDEAANKLYNPVGASSSPETFREGIVVNSMITDERSLLAWGKKQLQALNHPRINYTISSIASTEAGLGDTIRVQDLYASQQILLTSRVIQKTFSFANPTTNTLVLGEYSSVIGDKTKNIDLIAKLGQVADDITVVSEAAVKTQVIAEGAASIASQASSAVGSVATHANAVEDALSSAFNTAKSDVARLYSENKADTASLNSFVTEQLATTNKMVEDAKASAIEIGQTTAQNAQKALDEAKKDFTSSFASQASQTASMASEANSKASQYASQAKSEAVSAATSADGVVRSEFKFTTDSMTATIQQNKSDADGKITKAQTTATQALDGLSTKVEKTEYNKTTGDLTSKINTTSDTAEKSKQDIADIKVANDKQDNRMFQIEKDATGVKQTVSDLSTEQGKQRGSISKLEQRADGFDATVTKVNNLSVGGRNLLLNSKDFGSPWNGFDAGSPNMYQTLSATQDTRPWAGPKYSMANLRDRGVINDTDTFVMSGYVRNTGDNDLQLHFYATNNSSTWTNNNNEYVSIIKAHSDWVRVSTKPFKFIGLSTMDNTGIRFESGDTVTNGYLEQSGLKLEKGTVATDWTPAPEDVDSATATAQLTADKATTSLNSFKTDADGRISKAQADIVANANAITQKVSQSDYNAKTGELTQSVSKAQQTADTATQTIGTYKETNDKRVASAETNIKANSDAIKLTVSKTDFDKATGKINGDISSLTQRADGFDATVTKVNNLSVGGRNLLLGTSNSFTGIGNNSINGTFNDQGGQYYLAGCKKVSDLYNQYGPSEYLTISFDWVASGSDISGEFIPQWNDTPWGLSVVGSVKISKVNVAGHYTNTVSLKQDGYSTSNATGIRFRQDNLKGNLTISNIKLELGNVPTDWTPAPEDIESSVAQVKLTADGLYEKVNNPTTGIATRLLTAEGAITAVRDKTNELSSTLTQTANSIQASVATKTDKTTVLSLFSDNFEAGIKGHTGAIISGINGDASGMQIAGKHIVLTGDTTIQSGFTLTVDHLVGNTAQFIKTNWESAYSNIQIDGDGITIASKDNKAKTVFENGDTHWWSPRGEDIGYIGITTPIVNQTNADYMTIGVNGWQTTTKGDSHYDYGTSDFYGGDGIMFGVTDANTDKTGSYRKLMSWESNLTAIYLGVQTGWHAWEQYEFHKDVKVDGAMNVSGNLTTGGDINLGWTLRKNGTGFYPAHFNGLPGIHIVGTNSGIVFNESANKFYVVMGGHWNEITMSGNWGTGSWDN